MSATLKQIENLKKKYKNLLIEVIQTTEDGMAEAFTIRYQKNGVGNRASMGLIEVNAIWDERMSRPKGYIIVHGSEIKNGECLSIMVTEEFYKTNAKNGILDSKVAEWSGAVKV